MIQLEPHSVGDLLVEVVREYSRQDLPSAMLGKVIEGMRASASTMGHNNEDASFIRNVANLLDALRTDVCNLETETYGS